MGESLCDITKQAFWTSSSSKSGYGVESMFDGKTETFWQSDALLPHSITAQFHGKKFITKISIYMEIQTDETYTPITLKILYGDDPSNLTEMCQHEIQTFKGWEDIAVGISTIFVKIMVLANHQSGKDTRIRQLKVLGPDMTRSIDSKLFFVSDMANQFLTLR